MAKRLTMAEIDTILTLHKAGHSNREIATLLGVNRETVGKYLARALGGYQPNAPTEHRVADPNTVNRAYPAGKEIVFLAGCRAFLRQRAGRPGRAFPP